MRRCQIFIVFCGTLTICQLAAQPQSIMGFNVPTLTPIASRTEGIADPVLSLNGNWGFAIKEKVTKKQTISVPGEWEMQGFTVNEGETAEYSRRIEIPADWKGKQIRIRFDAVSSHALVKVNGKQIAEHEGSFVPFEADITSALNYTDDVLQVDVQALTISDRLACTSQYACHTVGGLLRKVTLFTVPKVHVDVIATNIKFDDAYKNADLIINVAIANQSGVPAKTTLRYNLFDASGKLVFQKTTAPGNEIGAGITEKIETKLAMIAPQQWNPEHPYLYRLQTSVLMNGIMLENIDQKVGFRQVIIRGNQVLVNGRPIILHGVNRHSIYPFTGRSVAPELDRKDAELFRAANCNYIRTSHYPPSEEFLNAADELGLFVESEASLCWFEHGASPIWKLWNYKDERYLPYMAGANMDNVIAGRNHPSIIIWSLGNESRWSPLWEKVNAIVKQLDPGRPTSFHDQCWGGFNNALSKADIANYHYPGINGPAATDTMSRPTLFGEYAHLSTYNRRELLTDPGIRSAYGAPLGKLYDSIYAHNGNLGGAIWSGIDDIFHMPDGRIIGYGPWGPIDAWRRPKPEYWGMKKAYSPVKIIKVNWASLKNGFIELTVENRYDFISLKEVKIETKVNGQSGFIASNIPSKSTGVIKIPAPADASELGISFMDPRGFVTEEAHYENKPRLEVRSNVVPITFSENESAIFVTQGPLRYTISKITGVINGVTKNGQQVVNRGPVFSIVPMNSEDGGKPNVAGETYQNNIYPIKNYALYTLFATGMEIKKGEDGLLISMNLNYIDAKGKQNYLFNTNGKLITDYELVYTGDDSIPYQYGLLLQVPKRMTELSWKSAGEWTDFPTNDIARNSGTALLNEKKLNEVEEWGVVPKGDWKDDANEMGSNDFRSTKHSIVVASLKDNMGNKVTVWSDGTQSSRAWLQDEQIQWILADYWNAGSEPFYGAPFSDGRIKIKNKILKGKLILSVE